MNKALILLVTLSIGMLSCGSPKKEIDKLELAKNYFRALDESNISEIPKMLTDSLLTKETAYGYEQVFSIDEYIEWMRWDSVFNPTYKILVIEEGDETVKAKVSKMDERILFLHEAPIVTTQIFRFDKDKITSIETVSYEAFDDSLFVKNREAFLGWIDENHPELNNFIFDQTRRGGMNYMKAIDIYKNR